MGIINAFKRVFPKLIGVDQLKRQTSGLKTMLVGLFTPKQAARQETFEQAMTRLGLSESALQKRIKEFKRTIAILALIVFFLVLYTIYLIYKKAYLSSLGCGGILLVILGQLFHQHFWLYQVQQRRLGCTFREWARSLLRSKI